MNFTILFLFLALNNCTIDECACEDSTASTNQKKILDEDEETCPFCKFFLKSPCRDPFKLWQLCIKNSEDATDCMEPFFPLKKCMDEHGMSMSSEDEQNSESNNANIEE